MRIITSEITLEELKQMAESTFGDLVKAVVDVKEEIMAVDGELHADEESLLIDNGSNNNNLWGINIYPGLKDEDWIEFDSMINLRPAHNNRSRGVEDQALRKIIISIVNKLVKR